MCNDRESIYKLGGPTVVANKFGYSVQRVANWCVRGIPPREMVFNVPFREALASINHQPCQFQEKEAA